MSPMTPVAQISSPRASSTTWARVSVAWPETTMPCLVRSNVVRWRGQGGEGGVKGPVGEGPGARGAARQEEGAPRQARPLGGVFVRAHGVRLLFHDRVLGQLGRRHDDRLVAREREEEGQEVLLLLRRELERPEERALVRVVPAALIVEVEHLLQREERAVVHVGRRVL